MRGRAGGAQEIFIAGPNALVCTNCAFIAIDVVAEDDLQIHQGGNLIDSDRNGSFAPLPATITAFVGGPFSEVVTPFAFSRPDFEMLEAGEAYLQVIADVGASLPRDVIDDRILQQLSSQSGAIIDSQDDVGGWPPPPSAPAPPTDLDRDGMADAWELLHGLDPNDPADRNSLDLDADYTNLEVYLARLIESEPAQPVPVLASAWGRALLVVAICTAVHSLWRPIQAHPRRT